MNNTRILQRNGRLTNSSAYNTVPHYNRSVLRQNVTSQADTCGCDTRSHTACKNSSCDECGYSYTYNKDSCGCKKNDISLAISSIGVQEWCEIYDLEEGFCAGTIFRQLDLPFCGMRGGCK